MRSVCCKAEMLESGQCLNCGADGRGYVIGVDLAKDGEERMVVREVCGRCGGSGEVETDAENRGGEVIGPDMRPCPECCNPEPDDFSGATEGER